MEPLFVEMSRLGSDEAVSLARKLRAANKLGRFAGMTDARLAERFAGTADSDWAGQLLVILLETVPGGRFADRLVSEWSGLEVPDKRFYGLVCLATACGVPARSAVLLRAFGGDSGRVLRSIGGGALAGLVGWRDREFITARHRVIAETTVRQCFDDEALIEESRALALALAPYVGRPAMMRRTAEARLARELMDADGPVVKRLGGVAERWFSDIEPAWGWTSRYWEQRALVALNAKSYGRARDFAQQAVGIEIHRFPLATAGLVHIASAQREPGLGHGQRDALFREGVGYLRQALRDGTSGPLTVHPYDILLNHASKIGRELYKHVPDWLNDALRDGLRDALERFPRDERVRRAAARLN